MRIVIALGGNALLRRGEPMTFENQRANVITAVRRIAEIVPGNDIVIAHGNGPQVGLLALQSAAYTDVAPYPLDVLGAQTEAMIGYLIEQELGNLIPQEKHIATLLTMVEVNRDDPAFKTPTKPIGPVYDEAQARELSAEKGWAIAPDGDKFRRVVASPVPQRIFEIDAIRTLSDAGTIVVCAGGGGIPTMREPDGSLRGVEAVIDKDLCSAKLAEDLDADLLIIATDVDGVYEGWGTTGQRRIASASPGELEQMGFAAGSMGPKVMAASGFAERTGNRAMIGSLDDIAELVAGTAGTAVTK
ncbi:carbamate kinase [Epidermidibacterium keratini]|uniref:Carbamate kinase n=1 Tax=Epidermidibacterium keratini TaxID=1891644 RepID=A0A7L4YNM6_9ACTN|nr:carbamate kinase [Epidermidibacterium keratini]QHC00891.1 carbamate kinase [Epidermidibacterium keratini]